MVSQLGAHMNSKLKSKQARPLMAAVRPCRGEHGQLKGSVTTDPIEVDQIATKAWTSIYNGAGGDGSTRAKEFCTKYRQYIYEQSGEFELGRVRSVKFRKIAMQAQTRPIVARPCPPRLQNKNCKME